jgi:hypothetical protein
MAINQQQRKFLLDRLEGIRSSKPSTYESVKLPDTARVKKARKQMAAAKRIVDGHQTRIENLRKKRNDAVRAAMAEAKQAVLFGDEKKAIGVIDAFEKRVF